MTTSTTGQAVRWLAIVARRAIPILLSLALAACPGYDPPHGDLILHNRSDQPVYVHLLRSDGVESLMAGPVEPEEDAVFFVVPRGQQCGQTSRFALRDEHGRDLALRDMSTDPVCDGDPWVWHGEPTDRATP